MRSSPACYPFAQTHRARINVSQVGDLAVDGKHGHPTLCLISSCETQPSGCHKPSALAVRTQPCYHLKSILPSVKDCETCTSNGWSVNNDKIPTLQKPKVDATPCAWPVHWTCMSCLKGLRWPHRVSSNAWEWNSAPAEAAKDRQSGWEVVCALSAKQCAFGADCGSLLPPRRSSIPFDQVFGPDRIFHKPALGS